MPAINEYLAVRRALGYELRTQQILLQSFARYVASRGHPGPLTCALMEDWARSGRGSEPRSWSRRLSVIRPFARHLSAVDPRTEVPPSRLYGPAHRRITPRVLTDEEVRHLLEEGARIASETGPDARSFSTLVGLLSCTGLRVSEGLRLQIGDVDLQHGLLHIRKTKFGKSRLVPLHPTAVQALADYARGRGFLCATAPDRPFFQGADGGGFTYSRIRTLLRHVRRHLGWDHIPPQSRPSLRALRHTFSCRRLLAWYEQGVDVNQRLPALSTYLGHGKVTDTYWYLSGIPALLAIAATRFHSPASREEVRPCDR